MKRMLSLLVCLLLVLPCFPALADGVSLPADVSIPREIRDFFASSSLDGYAVQPGGYTEISHLGRGYFFAVAQKGGHNVLYGFENAGGGYTYWLRADSCLPQGEGMFSLYRQFGELFLLSDSKLDLDDSLCIVFTRPNEEEQADTMLVFEANSSGQWNLRLYCYNYVWDEAIVTPGSVTYFLDEGSVRGTVYGVVETNLRYFSLSAFPRTLKEAREKLTNPPAIPSGELTAQRIKFTGGQKFPVYSGPGAEYLRPAGGKAAVSTNDWIQVFGSENGYILIQYAISSDHMRFGYIDQSALPKSSSVTPLGFAFADAEITASCALTDDPLSSRDSLRVLSAGQQVKWLSTMGAWVYVEVTGSGQSARGFVPASSISLASARRSLSAVFQNSVYAARADADVMNGFVHITVTADGPAAWSSASADKIADYRLYANNLPLPAQSSATRDLTVSGWRTVFTLSAAVPDAAGVIGLCPVYAQSGANANETIILSLRDAVEIK